MALWCHVVLGGRTEWKFMVEIPVGEKTFGIPDWNIITVSVVSFLCLEAVCSRPAVVQILSATWFIHLLLTTRVHENGTHVCSRVYRDVYESKELVNGHRHHMPGKQFENPARTL